jgi:hypothetical protein
MYPSGVWRGFWEQTEFGRQSMSDFRLRFHDGTITGSGTDVVGAFVFRGVFDTKTGEIRMVKQYLGKHQVLYVGQPDGEGSIAGTWSIGPLWSGPFAIQPVLGRATGEEPIMEITK